MKQGAPLLRHLTMRTGLVVTVCIALIGVVMAESHDPVALEPDAPRLGGAEVATFALG